MIAVTFALPAESSGLVGKLISKRIVAENGLKVFRGQLGHADVAILHTGVGRKHSQRSIETFLGSSQPELLIASGFAGSLTDRLNVGDLVLARNFSDPDFAARLMEGGAPATSQTQSRTSHTGSLELAPPINDNLRAITLVTVDAMIDSLEERRRIAQLQGADAIDMETEVIARACAAQRIPIVSLRVISDSPAAPFPAPPAVLFDLTTQRTNFGKLVPYLVAHPAAAGRLIRFARQIGFARQKLTNALVDAVPRLKSRRK